MKFQKFTALLLAVLLVLSLAACGTKDNEKKADMSSNDSAMTDEPKMPRRRSPCTKSSWSRRTPSSR